MIELIHQTTAFLNGKGIKNPVVGVILGTGLGHLFVQQIENPIIIPYHEIPNFPASTVESHHGKLIFGEVKGKKVLAMQGRFHYYEGYSFQQITLPVRVMKMLGARYLLISNAAGSLNRKWKKGEMMLIDDHINLQPDNPLRGKNDDQLGPRFPDMSMPYSDVLNKKLEAIADRDNIILRKGIYVGVPGPNLETRAECRFLRIIGADAVGMSTVPEVIVANHAGLPCCAVSVLTDDCDPDDLKAVNIEEIIAVASRAEPKLTDLYVSLIAELE
jgi:purine-nucleoside phosphorylase